MPIQRGVVKSVLRWETIEFLEYFKNNKPLPGIEELDRSIIMRAKVWGGWILRCGEAMVFIPDPEHKWKLGDFKDVLAFPPKVG